ncbi:hypothetical protein EZS27_036631 [termite gut metagenome]|uniref:ATPase AAA-type core domain-containing protein n=2 Tax=termite gut metagenome TaxID=433724 RepID=A0A5J4PUH4_9ZZZZ
MSFVATGLKSTEEYSYIDTNNIAENRGMKLFKTVGIYGANASGKSNIIRALNWFVSAIITQPSPQSNFVFLCDPFLYQKDSKNTESFFQIVLLIEGIKYRYGFTVKRNLETNVEKDNNFSREIVTNEWLYTSKSEVMYPRFERTNDEVITNNLENKDKVPANIPYKHTLFLAHAASFDSKGDCSKVFSYLNIIPISIYQQLFRSLSISHLKNTENKQSFLHLLSIFNLKYDDIILQEDSKIDKAKIFPQEKVLLEKQYESIKIFLNLKDNESSGTQKLFDLAGLLLYAFNFFSLIIVLDEIDSNFHPSLLIKLIGLFNNPEINKMNSQLLFTSHDTNLMSPSIMRRDQFYFTEKNEDDSTRLYSLADLKGVQNDADFAKQYLAGFYGALPILEEYRQEDRL